MSEFADVPGSGNGHISFDGEKVYVVSRSGPRIYTLSLEGKLEPFAGSGERGHEDGSLLQASFNLPNDLGISPDGKTLYINEVLPMNGGNFPSRIRMIRLTEE